MTEIDSTHSYDLLYFDTCKIIEEARDYAYRAVNVALTLRNWQHRCISGIVGAVSQQFENVAASRPHFGTLELLKPSQVSHLSALRGTTTPRDRTAKADLFGAEEQITGNERK